MPLRSGLLDRAPHDTALAPHRDALRYHEQYILRDGLIPSATSLRT